MTDVAIDPWANWRKRLAGERVPTYESDPDQGFYRKRLTEKTAGGATRTIGWAPVAYFYNEGQLYCAVGRRDAKQYLDRDRAIELWTWVSGSPIEEEQYRAVADRDEPWFDAPHTGVPAAASVPEAAGSVPGHNQPPEEPEKVPLAELRETIESAVGAVKDVKVTNDDEAKRAQASRSRLLELAGDAEKRRKAEKRPHWEAGQAVDAKYNPLITMAETEADRLRAELSAHETKKLREQEAAEAARLKAAEDHAAAVEKARRGKKAVPEPPAPEPAPPERSSTIKGGYGRAASVQAVKKGKITDLGKVLAHYIGNRNERILLAIAEEVQRDVKAGITVPGVTVETEADVR